MSILKLIKKIVELEINNKQIGMYLKLRLKTRIQLAVIMSYVSMLYMIV